MAETYAEKIQREYEEFREGLKTDVRAMIVKGNGYHPDKKLHVQPVLKPFPEIINFPQDDGSVKSVIVQNQAEKDKLLGKKHKTAKVVTVEVEAQPEPVKAKRGRPAKAKPLELPANLG